jgi:hypothetical protein
MEDYSEGKDNLIGGNQWNLDGGMAHAAKVFKISRNLEGWIGLLLSSVQHRKNQYTSMSEEFNHDPTSPSTTNSDHTLTISFLL